MLVQSSTMKMLMRCSLVRGVIVLLVLTAGVSIPPADAADREINVAAAADLRAALEEVASNFEKRTGVTVKLSFGASGALTQQIQNGAPFDVFFSADMDYPRQLIAGGLAEGCDVVSVRCRAVGAVGSEGFAARRRAQGHGCVARSVGEEDLNRESAACALWTRCRGCAEALRPLRKGQRPSWCLVKTFLRRRSLWSPATRRSGSWPWLMPRRPRCKVTGSTGSYRLMRILLLDQGVVVISRSSTEGAAAFLAFVKTPEVGAVLRCALRIQFAGLKYNLKPGLTTDH